MTEIESLRAEIARLTARIEALEGVTHYHTPVLIDSPKPMAVPPCGPGFMPYSITSASSGVIEGIAVILHSKPLR